MKSLEDEFNELMKLAGTNEQQEAIKKFCQKYENDEGFKAEISSLIKEGIAASGKRIEELSVKVQLYQATKMVNMSYIAKRYFNKSKSWLSQRINSHIVNGKPAKFTDEEMKTLNFALKDMGKKIGSISIHY